MYWIIEYTNGKSISEKEENFNLVSKENIRALYFQNGNDRYGVTNTGKFFINETEYDFKLNKGPQKYIQFKSAMLLTNGENIIDSWNLGFECYVNDGYEQYTININKEGEIYFLAKRTNFKSQKVEERKIRLQ